MAGIVVPNYDGELHADQVFMSLKNGLRDNPMRSVYHPVKAAVRNTKAYRTQTENKDAKSRKKFDQRQQILHLGFFTEKTKPFKTLGTVHLHDGDLILSALTEDVIARMKDMPKIKKDYLEKTRKVRVINRRPTSTLSRSNRSADKTGAGINALKLRLNEVLEMKKHVFGEQTLSGYLAMKEAEMKKANEPEPGKMLTPPYQDGAVSDAIEDLASIEKSETEGASIATKAIEYFHENAEGRKLASQTLQNKTSDIDDAFRDNWKKQKRLSFVKDKLRAINSLLCAIFNMRSKYIKLLTPLPHKLAVDLLRTEVVMDAYGKPTANWKNYAAVIARDSYSSDASRSSDATSEGKRPSTQQSLHGRTELSKNSRQKISTTVAPSIVAAKHSTRNLDAEELSNWRSREVRSNNVPVPPANSKVVIKPQKRKQNIFSLTLDSTPPWMTIPQTEKTIHDKKVLVFGKKQQKKRHAAEILKDAKDDFNKLQVKMDRQIQEECRKQRINQFKIMRCKFNAICVGPPAFEALPMMREAAKLKIRNRRDNTMQPMKWFSDLRAEIAFEAGLQDDPEINYLLSKVARFQYDDDQSIPFSKEKFCLLVMSVPAYMLLTGPMTYGLACMLKVLGLPQEILQYWLSGRKLEEISNMQKYIYF